MDFRFLAAGLVMAVLGFISGSTVFADSPRRSADSVLVQAAAERTAVAAAAAEPLPPAAELPDMPKLPATPKMPDVNAILNAPPKVRVIYVHRATATPARHTAATRTPAHKQEHEQEHESSDHERGDD